MTSMCMMCRMWTHNSESDLTSYMMEGGIEGYDVVITLGTEAVNDADILRR